MSASADNANFQMSAPFQVWGVYSFKLGRSFEGGVHLGRGALSDNYSTSVFKNID